MKGVALMVKYWENEKPETAQSERNIINYYRKAGKIQIAGLFLDKNSNEFKQGKTSTLDIDDASEHPEILDLLQLFIDDSRELIT